MSTKETRREYGIVFVAAVALMLGIPLLTGSLVSGYHWVDDHCIYVHCASLRSNPFLVTLGKAIYNDFSIRFRPLFMAGQVTGSRLFGTNLLYWSLYQSVEGVVTVVFLWKLARELRLDCFYSACLTGWCLLGTQYIIWCKQGAAENTGLMLCAITLFCIARAARLEVDGRKSLGVRCTALLFGTLCSLEKESFVLMLPAYVLLSVAFECDFASAVKDEKRCGQESVRAIIRRNVWWYAVYLLLFVLEVCVIVFVVGTGGMGYAGFSSDTPLKTYIGGIVRCMIYGGRVYLLFGLCAVAAIGCAFGKGAVSWIRGQWWYWVAGAYIVASQMVLHAKCGMNDRYLLPCVLGLALVFVLCVARTEDADKTRFFQIYKLMLCLFLTYNLLVSVRVAYFWGQDCPEREGGALYMIAQNAGEGGRVLFVTDIREHYVSAKVWLEERGVDVVGYAQDDTEKYDVDVVALRYTSLTQADLRNVVAGEISEVEAKGSGCEIYRVE